MAHYPFYNLYNSLLTSLLYISAVLCLIKLKLSMTFRYTLCRSLMVSNRILMQCYHAFVESILAFSIVCWFGSLDLKNRKKLVRIEKQCRKIVGNNIHSLSDLYEARVIQKALTIHKDPSHCLNNVMEILPSGRRFRSINSRTNRFRNTFFPTAIKLLNEKHYLRYQ